MNLSRRHLGTGPAAATLPTPTFTPLPVRRLPAEPVTVSEDQAAGAARTPGAASSAVSRRVLGDRGR
ncbi:hypothetical protein [Streptomyces sp. BK022]|uniref:hypothetical protein n=1 Tax=Streptomyces sp. BK022 TaxID=2512123 RepID=UPI00102A839F|nr:hypothetical protein [Streptomyces sp. BK022]